MATFREGLEQSPEGLDYPTLVLGMAQLRGANRALGELPLVVLTAVVHPPPPVPVQRARTDARLTAVWQELHAEVARHSSNGVHVLLGQVGRDIARGSPEHVVTAVHEVLASLRAQRRVAAENVSAGKPR